MRPRPRGLAARLALLFVTLATTDGALESGTRLLTDVTRPLLVHDPVVGRRYDPGLHGVVRAPEHGERARQRFIASVW